MVVTNFLSAPNALRAVVVEINFKTEAGARNFSAPFAKIVSPVAGSNTKIPGL